MPHDVFISNSTAGKLTANAICSQLESNGIRCWILPRDLNIGIAPEQSVANALAGSRVMIVVFSDYANRSDHVERQLELAFNHGVIVIPFGTESNAPVYEPQSVRDSVHWLDAMTPEMAGRLRSLCDLVLGIVPRAKSDPLTLRSPALEQEELPHLHDRARDRSQSDTIVHAEPERVRIAVAEPLEADPEKYSRPPLDSPGRSESDATDSVPEQPQNTRKFRRIKAVLLMLMPFAIICGVGIWHTKKESSSRPSKPVSAVTPSTAALVAGKVQHQDKFPATDPGWGTPDANWAIAEGKLRITPLVNSSAVLINHTRGLRDADITAEIVMSRGEDLGQLGGVIFWAKDYNDCYALVVSADGKFAVGHKLVGRWINPIAKTGNAAIKTGVGQVNKLRVRTEGNLLTASINDIEVATLAGEPPQGLSYIGLYGESAETTQNVWEFTNVIVTSAH
jgi:hypothetical protein